MYSIKNLLQQQPARLAAAVQAVITALILLNAIELTGEQAAGVVGATGVVLSLFTATQVTPVANLPEKQEAA